MLPKALGFLMGLSFFLLSAESAFPIGRIGHKITDGELDFYSTEIPEKFGSVDFTEGGGAILESGRLGSAPAVQIDLHAVSFRSQHADLLGKGQMAIEDRLRQNHDVKYERLQTLNGALSLLGESSDSFVGVSVCGDGRGYVVYAPKFAMTKNGIRQMLNKTTFEVPCRN